MIHRTLIFAMLAACIVAGCDKPPNGGCHGCLEHDMQQPLTKAQVRLARIDARVDSLPTEAENVYFAEWCGRDCSQITRFDLPAKIAVAVMSRYSAGKIEIIHPADQAFLLHAQLDGEPLQWWLHEAIPNVEGVKANSMTGQNSEFIMVPIGNVRRIYMRAFSM